ncbi:LysR family transcriptional regulator [Bradyrhizobium sp. Pear76]|uniref:LysR family transcriptional regulator n=1 Tax=Bradyrhizobium oropedii TaxID=1571201 RepID=UPI001E5C7488|nr:LysR family transcriptional regulator [Bradyrhizobium oropedii]MCC8961396.1 LysR family transcriptional regulator [Bradyrhizobium oropedii]
MNTKLEPRRLRYFMEVLNSGSVRGAAGALGMDASAVSRALGLLEQEYGAPLLERRGRGVSPTDAGQLLAAYVHRQQSERQVLLAQMDSIRKVETGHIDLVTGEGYVDWLAKTSLCRFMKARPKITISLDIGSTDEIVQQVVGERAHIGVLFNPPRDDRLRSHHSQPHPIKAMVPRGHPLIQLGRPLKLADLAPYPGAAMHPNYGLRQHVQAAEISEGVRLDFAFTTASFDALAHYVTAGLGYALVSRLAMTEADAGKVVALPMRNALLHRGRTHVVSRQGRTLPPAAMELLRMMVGEMRATSSGAR